MPRIPLKPPRPEPTFGGDVHRSYTPGERRAHLQYVERLYILGTGRQTISERSALPVEQGGLGRRLPISRVRIYIEKILKKWRLDSSAEEQRQAQIKRIYGHLHRAMSDKDHRAIAKFEDMLAKLTGAYAAQKVELSGGLTISQAADALDDPYAMQLLSEADELLEAAGIKQLCSPTKPIIDIEVENAPVGDLRFVPAR